MASAGGSLTDLRIAKTAPETAARVQMRIAEEIIIGENEYFRIGNWKNSAYIFIAPRPIQNPSNNPINVPADAITRTNLRK